MDVHSAVGFRRFAVTVAVLGAWFGAEGGEDAITPSVIGGVVSPAGDYPWMGALVSLGEESLTEAQFCGCSLIDERWILTAAHCLDGSRVGEIAVAFGAGDLAGENVVVPIDLIVMYPDYFDVLGLDNDLALARLVRPMDTIEPIKLSNNGALVAEGQPVRVIGWGMTDLVQNEPDRVSRLRQADLHVLDRDWINSEDVLNGRVSERMLPIGTLDPLVTSSFGDSGGPMIVADGGEERLAGVTSWGTGCFTQFLPYSVYTDVIPYFDWINGVVNRDRLLWEKAYGRSVLGSEDAYRVGGAPGDKDRLPLFVDEDGLKTNLRARPFSPMWKYRLSYYDFDRRIWQNFGWEFDDDFSEDGSVAISLPDAVDRDRAIIRSEQIARRESGSEMLELPVNQLVSGSFGTLGIFSSEDARAFRVSGLRPDWGYKIEILSEGGAVRYYLRSMSGLGADGRSGQIEGRASLEFPEGEKGDFILYLAAMESDVAFSVYLRQGDRGTVYVDTSRISGSLGEGNIELGESGKFVSSWPLFGSPGASDVFIRVDSSADTAISILDADTLLSAGQSNAWPSGEGEYMIFNRSSKDKTRVDNLIFRLMNVNPGEFGDFEMDVVQFNESRTLSLADEYDFRGLTVRDYTEDKFDDFEYVDRVELTGLGLGKRYVRFIGFESFRPVFAVRNITDNVIVQQFDRAFCYESSVIEFTAVSGKRYEAIVAASERSINKNYFLELSSTRPPNPYERFSTISSERDFKMEKWIRRMKLGGPRDEDSVE